MHAHQKFTLRLLPATLAFFLSLYGASGAENAPAPGPESGLYTLTLAKAADGDKDVTLYLSCPEGVVLQGWLAITPLVYRPCQLDVSGLKLSAGALKGTCKVNFAPDERLAKLSGAQPFSFSYTLEAAVKGTEVTGTFSATHVLLPEEQVRAAKIAGTLTGTHASRPVSAAGGKDFPCWRGRYANGTTDPCGVPLVDSLAKARLLWTGENKDLGIGYENRIGPNLRRGGYASPVVADGRVYMYHFLGSFEPPPPKAAVPSAGRRAAPPPPSPEEAARATVADDVLLGVDAVTGKTLWRSVFRQRGFNYQGLSKYGLHVTPCYADGKVYALGSWGGVFCVDARSGAPIWEASVGPVTSPSCLAYADGILICNNSKGGVLGFDANTGKVVWGPVGHVRSHCSPIRWTHKGREYFIADNLCVQARDGKIVWKANWGLYEARHGGGTYAVTEDYMVTSAGSGGKGGSGCFRIDAQSAKLVWSLPEGYSSAFTGPLIYDGYVYLNAGGKDPKEGGKPELVCVELTTGKIAGALPGAGGGGQVISPIETDGLIIARAPDKLCFFSPAQKGFKPVGEGLNIKWEWTITPAVADGRLYLRGAGYLLCYDLRSQPAP